MTVLQRYSDALQRNRSKLMLVGVDQAYSTSQVLSSITDLLREPTELRFYTEK